MKLKEKIELLKGYFLERFEIADKIRDEMSRELNVLQDNRKKILESIEKYKDDEFVTKILQAQKQFFDDNFDKQYQNIKFEIEDFERQFPLMRKFIKNTKNNIYNEDTLETYIDLFSSQLLRDIQERNELKNKKVNNG